MSFITTFSRNSLERFQRSCADKKNRTDRLTDGPVNNIIPSTTCFLGYKNSEMNSEIQYVKNITSYTELPPMMKTPSTLSARTPFPVTMATASFKLLAKYAPVGGLLYEIKNLRIK